MIEAIQGVPEEINLLDYVNDTGWSISNGVAVHDSHSEGDISVKGLNINSGNYVITFTVKSISGGFISLFVGSRLIATVTTSGSYTQLVTIDSQNILFRAAIGVSAEISSFTYKKASIPVSPTSKSTIAYSEQVDKWTSFYTYNPDHGFSLKGKLFTLKDGNLYRHDVGAPRNTFYGAQYKSSLEFPMNQALNVIKNFKNIEIQSNKLLVTTSDGIKTSLGQVSNLVAEDFRQFSLSSKTINVEVYSREGVFQANFLRDKNIDILNGDRLKGNFMTIELTTMDDQDFKLYSVYVNADASMSGI